MCDRCGASHKQSVHGVVSVFLVGEPIGHAAHKAVQGGMADLADRLFVSVASSWVKPVLLC